MTVRVRFAPSPSGSLHVGNVRTALFNWLLARHSDGVFVLRIEDTDRERTTEEAYLAALEDLKWLGMDWDEGPEVGGEFGPYRQSERAERHHDAAMQLVEEGAAYRCFCTPQELDERRQQARAEKRPPGYDGRCYRLSKEEVERNLAEHKPWAVRFHVPDGSTSFHDLVIGDVVVEHDRLDDFVIMRSDGTTLYQLAVVVDDVDMKITHVIRGDDHLSNTPKQILLHRAFGNPVPEFGHVPQVHGPDHKPLAKRRDDAAVDYYRNQGYLPEALFNYLAFLGWGTAEDTILSKEELIERFRIEDVHPSPAMIDFKKLDWMNGEYIRALPEDDFAHRLEPWFARAGFVDVPATTEQRELIAKIVPVIQTRIKRLAEAPDYVRPLFEEIEVQADAAEKWLRDDHVSDLLTRSIDRLESLDPWGRDEIEAALREIQTEMELKPKTAFMPFYVAITGTSRSAPIFDTMALLGKDRSLARLREVTSSLSG